MVDHKFSCAYCGAPLDKFGTTKALIIFAHIRCPTCANTIRTEDDIEKEED
jgi:hypothetical protein